jgi:hypothetical protein
MPLINSLVGIDKILKTREDPIILNPYIYEGKKVYYMNRDYLFKNKNCDICYQNKNCLYLWNNNYCRG